MFIKHAYYREIQKYYGVAGNFFIVENNTVDKQTEGIISKDSVTAVADSATTSAADSTLDYGPNAHIWMDSLGLFLDKNPNVSNEVLFKRFPQLDNNEEKIIEGVAYDMLKKQKGTTVDELKRRFPELFRDELYYQWHK